MGRGERFFFTEEGQPINVDRRVEIEKSPFENCHSNNWFNEESSVDAKIMGERCWGIT